jgi:hypothetical protein
VGRDAGGSWTMPEPAPTPGARPWRRGSAVLGRHPTVRRIGHRPSPSGKASGTRQSGTDPPRPDPHELRTSHAAGLVGPGPRSGPMRPRSPRRHEASKMRSICPCPPPCARVRRRGGVQEATPGAPPQDDGKRKQRAGAQGGVPTPRQTFGITRGPGLLETASGMRFLTWCMPDRTGSSTSPVAQPT